MSAANEQAEFMQGLTEALNSKDIALPSFPDVVVKIRTALEDPTCTADRLAELKQAYGIGFCNITKCCTVVCPEHITITDNAIIPLKERVVDRAYDPLKKLWRRFVGGEKRSE